MHLSGVRQHPRLWRSLPLCGIPVAYRFMVETRPGYTNYRLWLYAARPQLLLEPQLIVWRYVKPQPYNCFAEELFP